MPRDIFIGRVFFTQTSQRRSGLYVQAETRVTMQRGSRKTSWLGHPEEERGRQQDRRIQKKPREA